jgi:hypothetical protein
MIVCAMLVGPGEGERHLDHVLTRAEGWADRIVIYPDHIDPATDAVLDRHRITLWRSPWAASFLEDESGVRNRLLEALDTLQRAGDLIVILDADEELHLPGGSVREGLEYLEEALAPHESAGVAFLHLWDPEGRSYRVDGAWAPTLFGARIYRHEAGLRIRSRRMACSPVPAGREIPAVRSRIVVKHWGYAQPEDRQAKYDRYQAVDGGAFHSGVHIESILTEPTLLPVD